jgi:hypothetical protein
MIKLLDLIKEIEDDIRETAKTATWYHGSTIDIAQNQLNPLYRGSDEYRSKIQKKVDCWGETGSSREGVGIYFGDDEKSNGASSPLSYTGYLCDYKYDVREGFLYEMKLKPDAKLDYEGNCDITNLSKECFQSFRQKGIDAIIQRSSPSNELNLINPDAIQYFKKIKHWKWLPSLWSNIRGKRQSAIIFNNEEEKLDFLKKELGDYKIIGGDSINAQYISNDANIDDSFFIYNIGGEKESKKWINI